MCPESYVVLFNWLARAANIANVADFKEFVSIDPSDAEQCNLVSDDIVPPSLRLLHFFNARELLRAADHVSTTLSLEGTRIAEFSCPDVTYCLFGVCKVPVKKIEFESKQPLTQGVSHLTNCDGSRIFANFRQFGILHGQTIKISESGELVFAGLYQNGLASGRCIEVDPFFGTARYGAVRPEDGSFTGDHIAQIVFDTTKRGLTIRGAFNNGLPVRGLVRKVLISVKDERAFPIQIYFHDNDNFYSDFIPGANLASDYERSMAESAWIRNVFEDSRKPRAARSGNETSEGVAYGPTHSRLGQPPLDIMHVVTGPAGFYQSPYWLACLEGSGSKFLLYSFSKLTGEAPGDTLSPLDGQMALVKTHHQFEFPDPRSAKIKGFNPHLFWLPSKGPFIWRLFNVATFHGRTVLLIRNPYEAIISRFTHFSLDAYGSVKTFSFLNSALDCSSFIAMAHDEIKRWEDIGLDFLTMGTHVLVVHFEDVRDVNRVVAETERIRQHLGLPEVVEYNRRLKYFNKYLEEDTGYFARIRKSVSRDPFPPDLRKIIDGAMDRVDEMLEIKEHKKLPRNKFFNGNPEKSRVLP